MRVVLTEESTFNMLKILTPFLEFKTAKVRTLHPISTNRGFFMSYGDPDCVHVEPMCGVPAITARRAVGGPEWFLNSRMKWL